MFTTLVFSILFQCFLELLQWAATQAFPKISTMELTFFPTVGPMELAGLQQLLPLLEQQFHQPVYSYRPRNMKDLQ